MRPRARLADLAALTEEAKALAESFARKEDDATLVTLSGDLGAGKTAFTQALARALGVEETVTSPTFVLAKSYPLPEGGAFKNLLHIDAYRLDGGKDLEKIGFTHARADSGTLIVLEWPEIVADGLPRVDVAITLVAEADGSRTITYA